jgi:hypothetical protein
MLLRRRMHFHLGSVPLLTATATPDRALDFRLAPTGSVYPLKLTCREARRIARDLLDLSCVPRKVRT